MDLLVSDIAEGRFSVQSESAAVDLLNPAKAAELAAALTTELEKSRAELSTRVAAISDEDILSDPNFKPAISRLSAISAIDAEIETTNELLDTLNKIWIIKGLFVELESALQLEDFAAFFPQADYTETKLRAFAEDLPSSEPTPLLAELNLKLRKLRVDAESRLMAQWTQAVNFSDNPTTLTIKPAVPTELMDIPIEDVYGNILQYTPQADVLPALQRFVDSRVLGPLAARTATAEVIGEGTDAVLRINRIEPQTQPQLPQSSVPFPETINSLHIAVEYLLRLPAVLLTPISSFCAGKLTQDLLEVTFPSHVDELNGDVAQKLCLSEVRQLGKFLYSQKFTRSDFTEWAGEGFVAAWAETRARFYCQRIRSECSVAQLAAERLVKRVPSRLNESGEKNKQNAPSVAQQAATGGGNGNGNGDSKDAESDGWDADDWNAEWDEEEEANEAANEEANEAEKSVTVTPKPETENWDAADWQWDEEGSTTATASATASATTPATASASSAPSPDAYFSSTIPNSVHAIAVEFLREGERHDREIPKEITGGADNSGVSGTSGGSASASSRFSSAYRAELPNLYSFYCATALHIYRDADPFLLYNDLTYLCELLTTLPGADAELLATFRAATTALRRSTRELFQGDVAHHVARIQFRGCHDGKIAAKTQNQIDTVANLLTKAAGTLRNNKILSESARNAVLATIVNSVLSRWIAEVFTIGDISELEAEQMAAWFNQLAAVVFSMFPADVPLDRLLPSYHKFVTLAVLLPAHIDDIMGKFAEGDLYDFSTAELTELLTALFADSEKRREAVREIEEVRGE